MQRPVTLRIAASVLLLAGLVACHRNTLAPPAGGDCDLVAVVELESQLVLQHHRNGIWKTVAFLPHHARAIRVTPDGQRVAWVIDTASNGRPISEVWSLRVGSVPVRHGEAGFRRYRSFALEQSVDRLIWLSADGLRSDAGGPFPGTQHLAGHRVAGDCAYPSWGADPICAEAVRLLDGTSGRLLMRTHEAVLSLTAGTSTRQPIGDVTEGRLMADGRWVVVQRHQGDGLVRDRLVTSDGTTLLEAPILGRPAVTDHSIVVVRADGDVMTQLLAHAPDEFDGELIRGEAVEVIGDSIRAVAGLEDRTVRIISTCR